MKKKKLKLKFRIILTLILVMIVLIPSYVFLKEDHDLIPSPKINYIDKVLSYNIESINEEFLTYVDDNYDSALEQIDKYLEINEYDESIWHTYTNKSFIVLNDEMNELYINNDRVVYSEKNDITITGDFSVADNYHVMQAYNERNEGLEGVMSPDVINYLKNSGTTIINSEFAFSTDGVAMPGKAYVFEAKPENASIFLELGTDLVTLANNHVYDYGSSAFNTTLNTFDEYNINRIGADINLEKASEAQYYIINGYKVAIVNANRSEKYILTPGATETTEGVVRCYDPEHFVNMIKEEDLISDIVIAIIHWGKEYSHEIEDVLLTTSKQYIDAGADAIVGHHAHVLQPIEYYNGKPIYYNLGNFLFNNKTLDIGIANLKINDDKTITSYFLPGIQSNVYTQFAEGDEKTRIIDMMNGWSQTAYIDETGLLQEKK